MSRNRFPTSRAGVLALLPLFLLLACPLAALAQTDILILKSNDNPFFNTTIERLINHTGRQAKFTIRSLKSLQKAELTALDAKLIVTLGHEAAKFTETGVEEVPVIHSYITEFQYSRYNFSSNHQSLLLEQPLARYTQFIKLLLGVKNIGIIRTESGQIEARQLDRLQRQQAVQINQVIFRPDDNPVEAVRKLLKNNDVLLTLPAPEIYNRQSLKGILLTSYRLNRPVISYSPAHVKSGALAAIYTSPENIGKQLATMVDKLLHGVGDSEAFQYAAEFDISINRQVARSLGLELAGKDELLQRLRAKQP